MQPPDYHQLYAHRDACFVLVDAADGHLVARYNPRRCAERLAPCSTFKVPLAQIALDHHLIDAHTRFRWDGRRHDIASWNADQTPASWLANSVVWVSQGLTPRLGPTTLAHDLAAMKFGNADASGPIKTFWLGGEPGTSLAISADEQVAFWRSLLHDHAAVLPLLPRLAGRHGAVLAGKTGTGYVGPRRAQLGWYVGWLHAGKHDYVLASNTTDQVPHATKGPAGPADRAIAETILRRLGLY